MIRDGNEMFLADNDPSTNRRTEEYGMNKAQNYSSFAKKKLSHIIYEKMKERYLDFVARLEEHGIIYIKVAGEEEDPSSFTGSSWKSAYKTDDQNVGEQMAAKMVTNFTTSCCWQRWRIAT